MKNALFTLILILNMVCLASAVVPNGTIVKHEVEATLTPALHTIDATDHFVVDVTEVPDQPVTFFINRDFGITELSSEGQALAHTVSSDFDLTDFYQTVDDKLEEAYEWAVAIRLLPPEAGWATDSLWVKIAYHGVLNDTTDLSDDETDGLIDERGTFLAGGSFWYPDIPYSVAPFTLTVTQPDSFRIISQGYQAEETVADGLRTETWRCDHPMDEIYCIGGDYIIFEETYRDVSLQTWLYSPDSSLAQNYIDWCKKYVDMYGDMIGPYPFEQFAVVENFFQTGYGMPGFTLLGSLVIRMPYIFTTSLGHEVLHNWWGNSVYVDYQAGNWCEGLTTYLADQWYKQQASPADGLDYRRNTCQTFTSFVKENNDFPVLDFRGRHDAPSQAIGYGKVMMIFHMLRQKIGDEAFFGALQELYREYQYKKAAWTDLRAIFAKHTDLDLDPFFEQWLNRTGGPTIQLGGVEAKTDGEQHTVAVTLKQAEPPFAVDVPIRVQAGDETIEQTVHLSDAESTFELNVPGAPEKVSVDPEHDVFRLLLPGEVPPTFTQFFGDTMRVLAMPGNASPEVGEAYDTIAERMNRGGKATTKTDAELTESDWENNSILIFGGPGENSLLSPEIMQHFPADVTLDTAGYRLFEENYADPNFAVAFVMQNLHNPEHFVAVVAGHAPDVIRNGLRKVVYYGKYSYLAFDDATNIAKGVWDVRRSPLEVTELTKVSKSD